jgi:class 3 adenylate cyclase
MPPVRRLTAILAADVVGYSRLMGADEEGTHERVKAHLGELVNPKIAEHRGRVVKNSVGTAGPPRPKPASAYPRPGPATAGRQYRGHPQPLWQVHW